MTPLLVPLLTAALLSPLCEPLPSFIENDSIVFPEDNTTSSSDFTDRLGQCLGEDKIEFNGECRALLTTSGVCQEKQWLVLDLASASLPKPKIVGRCAPKRCPFPQHFWAESRRCVGKNESSLLCPAGNDLDTDMFGDGYCRCVKSPVHARDRSGTGAGAGACWPVYRRGPCPEGKVWAPEGRRVQCVSDACGPSRRLAPGKTLVPWSDGRCYVVEDRGPCKQGYVVLVNSWTLQPECGDSIATLNLLSAPCSGTDHSGQCTQPVKTPLNHFLSQVADQANKKRTRKISNDPK